MRRILVVCAVGVASIAVIATASQAAEPLDAVSIEVTPTEVEVQLGERIDLTVTVTNNGEAAVEGLIAHIDITDLDVSGSVDPEDWVKTLSRDVGTLEAGQSATRTWNVQPISSGSFTVYAVALAPEGSTAAASNVVTVDVAHRASLNPQGVLPVSIGVPAVIGALLLTRLRRRIS